MKKETKCISITFIVIVLVGMLVNGVYCSLKMNSTSVLNETIILSIFMGCCYLVYVCKKTRRCKVLGIIGIIGIIVSVIFSAKYMFIKWEFSVYDVIPFLYGGIVSAIAMIQETKVKSY